MTITIHGAGHADRLKKWLGVRLGAALAMAAGGDFLFFNQGVPGLSLVMFLTAAVIGAIGCNKTRAGQGRIAIASLAWAMGLLPYLDHPSLLPFCLAMTATALFLTVTIAGPHDIRAGTVVWVTALPIIGGASAYADTARVYRLIRKTAQPIVGLADWLGWIIPMSILMIFAALFGIANPVLGECLSWLDPRQYLQASMMDHAIFWLFIAYLTWPLWHFPRLRGQAAILAASHIGIRHLPPFSETIIVRSLFMLNALFIVQTMSDAVYLWGKRALPHGLSYASYAHQGAYILVLTSILAAVTAMIAMETAKDSAKRDLMRKLIAVFLCQNFILMISAAFRLDLYVRAYLLTCLRLCAFIWMAAVAAGIAMMTVQVLYGKSNAWLLKTMTLISAAILYGSCLLNFPYIIADYNVTHCREATGRGMALDLDYIFWLGPDAVPSIDRFARQYAPLSHDQARVRDQLAARVPRDWREWNIRAWRLDRYLAKQAGSNGQHSKVSPS